MFTLKILRFYSLILVAVLSGCAGTVRQADTPIFYPPPPEEPKIIYLKNYRGPSDFKEPSFLDAIFGSSPSASLQKPHAVFAQNGVIYVTDTIAKNVAVIDTRALEVRHLGDRGVGTLSLPLGVVGAPDGTVYVADGSLKTIYVYDKQGKFKSAIGKKGEMNNPSGIALHNELGRLYITDSYGHTVHVYTTAGERLFAFGSRGGGPGEFNYPSGIAIDRKAKAVFVVDTQNFRVQVFDLEGKFLRKFGEAGDSPGNFARPKGIGVDSEGHVYVVDAAFGNFQVFDGEGRLLLYVGWTGTDPGTFQLPAGLYIDDEDGIYVADSVNHRVQVFQYLSEKWKKSHPEEYKKYLMKPGTDQK